MTSIPQCMHCKNGKIENGIIICKKHQVVPEKIADGTDTCKYYENVKKIRVQVILPTNFKCLYEHYINKQAYKILFGKVCYNCLK